MLWCRAATARPRNVSPSCRGASSASKPRSRCQSPALEVRRRPGRAATEGSRYPRFSWRQPSSSLLALSSSTTQDGSHTWSPSRARDQGPPFFCVDAGPHYLSLVSVKFPEISTA
jgi:hypothetical protein